MHPRRLPVQTLLTLLALLLAPVAPLQADELDTVYELSLEGRSNEAMERLNNYLAISPRDARGRFLKGLLLAGQGETTRAIEIFTGLTVDHPDLAEPYNNLAVLLAQTGNYDAALAMLERALELNPDYAGAYANLGDIHLRMAADAYRRLDELDPGNDAVRRTLEQLDRVAATLPDESALPDPTER